MNHPSPTPSATVSNLVPVWEAGHFDSGGAWNPEGAPAAVIGRVVESAIVVEQLDPERLAPRRTRMVTPPERFDPTDRIERRSAYELHEEDEGTWAEQHGLPLDDDAIDDDGLPVVDYDLLHRREIARQLLRQRLVGLAEMREHRSAYEIAFIFLIGAVAILLAAPPLVQVLLAMHGVKA